MNITPSVYPPGRAALFKGKGKPFEIITREIRPIRSGEILVKVLYTTLCGSDIHTFCGRRQEPAVVVLGHEITGEILAIDPDHPGIDFRGNVLSVGDRLVWSIFSVPPGNPAPRKDIPQKSPNLFKYGHALSEGDDVFSGGLAEYCIIKNQTAVLRISTLVPLKVAATISCAHSTVAGAIRLAGDIAGKSIMIFGAGLLGLSCVAMCREAGAAWIGLMDNDANRLDWGKQFGADEIFCAAVENNSALPWPPVDMVFDMTGNPQVMEAGILSLRTGGVAIWIGAVYPADPVRVDAQHVVRQLLQIRGLHNYNYDDFLNAAAFIEHHFNKYPFEDLVEEEFELDQMDTAFAYASERKPVRVGIVMG